MVEPVGKSDLRPGLRHRFRLSRSQVEQQLTAARGPRNEESRDSMQTKPAVGDDPHRLGGSMVEIPRNRE
jgi:hypothetical protein